MCLDYFLDYPCSTVYVKSTEFSYSVTIPGHNMFEDAFDINLLNPVDLKICLCVQNDPLAAVICEKNPPVMCATGIDTARHQCPTVTRNRRSVIENQRVPSVDISKSLTWTRRPKVSLL